MNGEGFAFFRWHTLRYPHIEECPGSYERYRFCLDEWRALQRKEP